jgi:hypothetical protein
MDTNVNDLKKGSGNTTSYNNSSDDPETKKKKQEAIFIGIGCIIGLIGGMGDKSDMPWLPIWLGIGIGGTIPLAFIQLSLFLKAFLHISKNEGLKEAGKGAVSLLIISIISGPIVPVWQIIKRLK